MVDGPQRPITGVLRPQPATDRPRRYYFGSYGAEPTLLALPAEGLRLTRAGRGFRAESLAGELLLCGDGKTVWDFRTDPQCPLEVERRDLLVLGPAAHLVTVREAGHWVGKGRQSRPVGPVSEVEFLGRRCWVVTLDGGAPERSSRLPDLRITVDQETGAVLAAQSVDETAGGPELSGAAFTDLTVADSVDPTLFRWQGPVAPAAAAQLSEQERNADWFRQQVAAEPLELPISQNLRPLGVDLHDAAAGEFAVFLGDRRGDGARMLISRRVRSAAPWQVAPVFDEQFHEVWSTEGFDWSVQLPVGRLDAGALARLREWLHPGRAVSAGPATTRMRPSEH